MIDVSEVETPRDSEMATTPAVVYSPSPSESTPQISLSERSSCEVRARAVHVGEVEL